MPRWFPNPSSPVSAPRSASPSPRSPCTSLRKTRWTGVNHGHPSGLFACSGGTSPLSRKEVGARVVHSHASRPFLMNFLAFKNVSLGKSGHPAAPSFSAACECTLAGSLPRFPCQRSPELKPAKQNSAAESEIWFSAFRLLLKFRSAHPLWILCSLPEV